MVLVVPSALAENLALEEKSGVEYNVHGRSAPWAPSPSLGGVLPFKAPRSMWRWMTAGQWWCCHSSGPVIEAVKWTWASPWLPQPTPGPGSIAPL